MAACPDIEQLELFARDELTRQQATQMQAHLAACTACRARHRECVANREFAGVLRGALDAASAVRTGRSAAHPAEATAASPSIAGYQIVREVHRGGQGVVYEAIQTSTRRRVALKVLLGGPFAGPASKRRFEREVELAAGLRHPNIVAIHDSGVASGWYYLAMDYVDGVRLGEVIGGASPERTQPRRDTLRLFAKICDAVNHAHQRGVLHRDLKPSNILVDVDDEPRVLDFGLAKQVAPSEAEAARTLVTAEGQVFGTLAYMSPEQARGAASEVDIRSDVYSLGVILYELLTGVLPYDVTGGVPDVLDRILHAEPARPSAAGRAGPRGLGAIDDEVETIVQKALAKEPARRYQTAGELGRDIERYLGGDTIEAKRDSALYVLKKTLRRYRVPLGVAGVIIAVLAGATAFSTRLWRREARLAEERRQAVYANHIELADAAYESHEISWMKSLLYTCPRDLRGWEWYFLLRLSDRSLRTLRGHRDWIHGLAVSPDGRRVASGSWDGTIRIWDVATGADVSPGRMTHPRPDHVAFLPDGERLLAAGTGGSLRIWDLVTGEDTTITLGPFEALHGLTCSPDGRRAVVGYDDGRLSIVDLVERQVVRTWPAHAARSSTVVVASPNGRWFASMGDDRTVAVWDADSAEPIVRFSDLATNDGCLAFSPDSRLLAVGSADGAVTAFDTADWSRRWSETHHQGRVRAVAFSPRGDRLASAGQDLTVRIWNLANRTVVATLYGHERPPIAIAYTPDARAIITASEDRTLKVWDAASPEPIPMLAHGPGGIDRFAISPDGGSIATGDANGTVSICNLATGKREPSWQAVAAAVTGLAFDPNGNQIVTSSYDGTVKLWNAGTGGRTYVFWQGPVPVDSVAFSPDGQYVAAGGYDATVRVWDAATQEIAGLLEEMTSRVTRVAFSPDGREIAVAVARGPITIWEWKSNGVRPLRGHDEQTFALAFSPDGTRLASGGADNLLKVWDLASGKEQLSLRGHDYDVMFAAFSPDGERLVSSGWDRMIVWDAVSGAELLRLQGHTPGVVRSALFCPPDGRVLISGGGDGTLRIWEAASPESVRWNPEVAFQLGRAAQTRREEGNEAETQALFGEAAEIYQEAMKVEPDRERAIIPLLIELCEEWGRVEEAAAWRSRWPKSN